MVPLEEQARCIMCVGNDGRGPHVKYACACDALVCIPISGIGFFVQHVVLVLPGGRQGYKRKGVKIKRN